MRMKLGYFLSVIDDDTFVQLVLSVYGMIFTARHKVGYIKDDYTELIDKMVKWVRTVDGELHIILDD